MRVFGAVFEYVPFVFESSAGRAFAILDWEIRFDFEHLAPQTKNHNGAVPRQLVEIGDVFRRQLTREYRRTVLRPRQNRVVWQFFNCGCKRGGKGQMSNRIAT